MALPREMEPPNWYRIDLSAFTASLRQHDGVLLFLLIFFSLIFAILFIFFYFVCKCKCGSRFRSSSPGSGQPEAQAAAKKGGLDAESVESLPAVTYASVVVGGEAEAERNECCICLGLFEEAEMVKVMPDCCHLFHAQCVDTWLSNRSSCPLCRASLDSVSVHIDISNA
ncbi:unnamed protein product [Cuscuta epithymum]|uniref:RING-type E3 ubiquitin transferase n=1 Tax=Cuscuta epithymum TaxID=186058 RepID=A0AAV0F1A2_9ASTE|nr:unnamed protein product [Cuscuta epithymum]